MTHRTPEQLQAALAHIRAAPTDNAPIEMLCFRPGYGQRQIVDRLELTVDRGIPGERWLTAPWLKMPDGRPDPRIQVSILPKRVMDTVWQDRSGTVHPGDPIVADIETSVDSLPVGTRLQAGTAVLEVSDAFNEGCVKWKTRYGTAAKDWIVTPENRPLRLRGLLCRIVQDGVVRVGDRLHRV
ncbi:hypothetical protein M8756_13160 [Lutimaribacter sp. EGI FJ00015]|uniref:Uncharacterized protein n=1 Tax=Lutimaribacter degradans TaxID=2945989 RepID=A0ACC5ZYF3_9RHOB|nr:hypothetical protein [Lutimaribacter sp. EGI FJ00013]MCM2563082.1 hypothetical protein [Lutimaribacter sp. EGI FJ00013]MCO0614261.1 hypothetical protein [Lutimaribacter sp. EGI FJ00015]MCO0637071.1 hypothetical protein [Lutimaribacter sp. EGI FJ00014]